MSNVVKFPDRFEDDQMNELKERLVEDGIFNKVSEIPTQLVLSSCFNIGKRFMMQGMSRAFTGIVTKFYINE